MYDHLLTLSSHDDERQELKVGFGVKMSRSTNEILCLSFDAVLNDKGIGKCTALLKSFSDLASAGFHRLSYQDDTGMKKYIACTNMEPVDARRVNPTLKGDLLPPS